MVGIQPASFVIQNANLVADKAEYVRVPRQRDAAMRARPFHRGLGDGSGEIRLQLLPRLPAPIAEPAQFVDVHSEPVRGGADVVGLGSAGANPIRQHVMRGLCPCQPVRAAAQFGPSVQSRLRDKR